MTDERTPQAESQPQSNAAKGFGDGYTLGLHLMTTPIVGLIIGFGLDYVLGTTPWLMLVFLALGFVAGFRTFIAGMRRLQAAQEKAEDEAKSG